jgi:membrane protein
MERYRPLLEAIYRLYQNSGFAMAGSVAFSFILSIFPFCIFLGAVASVFGGRELAAQAVERLFAVLPKSVAEALAPQISQIMGSSQVGLLTLSGVLALFFATSANETLRTALNGAYRVVESRPYFLCLGVSALFVLLSAVAILAVTWIIVVGPKVAQALPFAQFVPLGNLLDASWLSTLLRYAVAGGILVVYLVGVHVFLADGTRSVQEVWPGILLSLFLMLLLAGLYSRYLELSDYTKFYAGLSQIMVALIFFQAIAVIILLGAELNRGIIELSRLPQAALTPLRV